MKSGAEILVESLLKEAVEVVFAYPGGAALEIFDVLGQTPEIRLVVTRNEQGAAHAASGYARVSKKPGVCLATSGPGATNLITGIATAYMDSIPLVVFTGQVPLKMIGTDAFQEVDITGISEPITKHNYLVKAAASIPRIVKEAFYIASSGRPGPVLIDLPKDVAQALAKAEVCEKINLRGYKPNLVGHQGQLKQIIKLLKEAKRPLICAGGGVLSAQAEEELLVLAEKLNIPVVNTMMGLGSISREHPLALGMLGTYGLPEANLAVQTCDLFIALGMRFDDRVTGEVSKFAPQAKIIHLDIDSAEIGKNVAVDLPLVGDLKIVLQQLLADLPEEQKDNWWSLPEKKESISGLTFKKIMMVLNEFLDEKTIVTTDVGQHQVGAAQWLKIKKPRTFISSGGLGTMGYGIPAGIGAQIAAPEAVVLVLTGDGSFQMGLAELGTCLEENLPLKIILINNQALGMVKQLQDHYCQGRHTAVHFRRRPEFKYLAKAYGALSLTVEKAVDLREKINELLSRPGLGLLEIKVAAGENVYPVVLGGKGLEEMEWGDE